MKNEYHVLDFSSMGLPDIEVSGEAFCHEDLYELVGRDNFVTTFHLKDGSFSCSEYGKSVTGTILYPPQRIKKPVDDESLKIRCLFEEDLTPQAIEKLKYGGLNVSDIEFISFLPIKRKLEFHKAGEKKVPGIINVDIDDGFEKIDVVRWKLYLLARKDKDGIELADYEKEEFIGLRLAINNGRIDSRMLERFGFNKEKMMSNVNVWDSCYSAKAQLGFLSSDEEQKHMDIKGIIWLERMKKLLKEISNSNATTKELNANKKIVKEIFDAVISFKPCVLLHGKRQVYWNVDSYIHITFRHFQKYQLGNFKKKTSFSYRLEDLKILIEKVLKIVQEEYEAHFSKNPGGVFRRENSMAIEFNGDHYAMRIMPDGRLEQFYAYHKPE